MSAGLKTCLALVASGLASGCATLGSGLALEAAPVQAGRFGPATERAAPPSGLVRFCAARLDLCDLMAETQAATTDSDGRVETVQLTPALWRAMQAVNADVNWQIAPESDEAIYGVREVWAMPISEGAARARRRGDCEDYVLEKRARLLAWGVPAAALQITIGQAPEVGRHTVLIVRTDRGDFVLDNRTAEIVGVDQAPYQWLTRQAGAGLLNWAAIPGDAYEPAPVMTAYAASQAPARTYGARGGPAMGDDIRLARWQASAELSFLD